MLSKQDIEELLEQPESRSLDFKEGQYRFQGATDEQKSELLKDILAFANTQRMHDAHILVGVREVKGGKSLAVGVTDHLDDASVQQFVNQKTNRAVAFSYEITPFDGVELGVLCIAQQQDRPLYTAKRYGSVPAECVYVRHGTSTAVASPDDISNIARSEGRTARQPIFSIFLYDADTEQTSKAQQFKRKLLSMPHKANIPDFEWLGPKPPKGDIKWHLNHTMRNKDFYREGALFLSQEALLVPLKCCVQNTGDAPANDVRVVLKLVCDTAAVTLITERVLLRSPRPRSIDPVIHTLSSEVHIEREQTGWVIRRNMPKMFAKQGYYFRDELYLRVVRTADLTIQASVWADELPSPTVESLTVHVDVENKQVTVEELRSTLDKMALETMRNKSVVVAPAKEGDSNE